MARMTRLSVRTRRTRNGAPRAEPAVSGTAPRLHARAFEILAGRIADGTLPAGARLLESHVAEDFGISRAPARQALQRLAAEGAIIRAEGPGYVVRDSGTGARPIRSVPSVRPIRLTAAPSWERIYSEVEGAIASRTAIGGWRVIESELANFYDVSRTVARDVVARLHLRGVIKKDEKARWYAPALTPDYVAELYEMRWLLEPVALVNALAVAPRELVTELRRRLQDALAHAATLDGPALDSLEDDLHMRLLGYCRNRSLMDTLRLYHSLLIAHSFLYARAPHLYPIEPFLPEHLKIVECAEAGQTAEAAKAMEEHLRLSLDRAIDRIDVVVRQFRPDNLPYLELLKATA
jgi:DNA-binding GntR family transcriptional regulator